MSHTGSLTTDQQQFLKNKISIAQLDIANLRLVANITGKEIDLNKVRRLTIEIALLELVLDELSGEEGEF